MFDHIGYGLAASLGIALVVGGLVAALGRNGSTSAHWGLGLGFGMAYAVGHAFMREWVSRIRFAEARDALRSWSGSLRDFPLYPGDVVDWLPWMVAAATISSLFHALRRAPTWCVWEHRILLSVVTLWLLLSPLVDQTWDVDQSWRHLCVLEASCLGLWIVLDRRAKDTGSAVLGIAMLCFAAMAVSLTASGASSFGTLAAVAGASSAGLLVACRVNPRQDFQVSVVPLIAVLYPGLLVCGIYYSELSQTAAVLLLGAPLATWIDRLRPISRLQPWNVAILRIVVLLVPLTVAVAWSITHRPPDVPADGYGQARSLPLKSRPHQGET